VLAEVHDLRTKNATLVTEVTELKKTVGALKRENLRLAGGGGAKPSASASAAAIERSISGSAVKPRTTRTAASSHLKDAQRVRVDKENRLDLNGSVASVSTTLKTPATVTKRRVAPSTRPAAAAPTALNLTAQLANGGAACGERDISLMLDIDDDVDADDEPMLAAAKPFDMTGDLANLSVIAPKAELSPLTDEEDDDDDDDAAEDPLHLEQAGDVY
jgi:hypothetical protein